MARHLDSLGCLVFAGCQVRMTRIMIIKMMIMLLMSEHGLGGRPEAAGGGQPPAAACQHGRDPAQPRGDGRQVRGGH